MNLKTENTKNFINKILIKTKAIKGNVSKEQVIYFIIQLLGALVIYIMGTWKSSELTQPIIYSDEYGYWAAASYLLGIDWSSVTSHVPYYSYGYGIILAVVRSIGMDNYYSYNQVYQLALTANSIMLVLGYFISVQICKRYFSEINKYIRLIVCVVIFLYSSNIFYAHLTLTETTILFSFWVYLYLLMKVTDSPTVINHILFGFISVYMYTVHQRTLAVLIAATIIVVYQNILKKSKVKLVAAYFLSVFVLLEVHMVIKAKLQNDFYFGNAPITVNEIISKLFTAKTYVMLAGGIFVLLLLYLIAINRKRLVLIVTAILMIIGVVLVVRFIPSVVVNSGVEMRISNNDFSGQIEKIQALFTIGGLQRLLISIAGKWFYMASATGLIICFGIKDIFVHFVKMLYGSIVGCINTLRGLQHNIKANDKKEFNIVDSENIWKLGVFLTAFGSFMVSAIYKAGFYKNDDLLNGRYTEFLVGVLLLISVNRLINDKNWLITLIISVVLYVLTGIYLQYAIDTLQRTEFELCHSVMLGRIVWNYEVPYGKLKLLMQYVLPMGIAFMLMTRLADNILSKRFDIYIEKIRTVRWILALAIPAIVWTYLSMSIIDHYNISVDKKYARSFDQTTNWLRLLQNSDGEIYFIDDDFIFAAESLQFRLPNKSLKVVASQDMNLQEDAFYIINNDYIQDEQFLQKYIKICENSEFSLIIRKDAELIKYYEMYRE